MSSRTREENLLRRIVGITVEIVLLTACVINHYDLRLRLSLLRLAIPNRALF